MPLKHGSHDLSTAVDNLWITTGVGIGKLGKIGGMSRGPSLPRSLQMADSPYVLDPSDLAEPLQLALEAERRGRADLIPQPIAELLIEARRRGMIRGEQADTLTPDAVQHRAELRAEQVRRVDARAIPRDQAGDVQLPEDAKRDWVQSRYQDRQNRLFSIYRQSEAYRREAPDNPGLPEMWERLNSGQAPALDTLMGGDLEFNRAAGNFGSNLGALAQQFQAHVRNQLGIGEPVNPEMILSDQQKAMLGYDSQQRAKFLKSLDMDGERTALQRLEREYDFKHSPQGIYSQQRQALGEAIVQQVRVAHPDWTNQQVYADMHRQLALEGFQPQSAGQMGAIIDEDRVTDPDARPDRNWAYEGVTGAASTLTRAMTSGAGQALGWLAKVDTDTVRRNGGDVSRYRSWFDDLNLATGEFATDLDYSLRPGGEAQHPDQLGWWTRQIGEQGTYTALFLANPRFGMATTALIESAGYEQMRRDLLARGYSEGEARNRALGASAAVGIANAAIEKLEFGAIMRGAAGAKRALSAEAKGRFRERIAQWATNVVKAAGYMGEAAATNAPQELLQELTQIAAEIGVDATNPNVQQMHRALEAYGVGGLVSFLFAGVGGGIGATRQWAGRQVAAAEREQIEQKLAESSQQPAGPGGKFPRILGTARRVGSWFEAAFPDDAAKAKQIEQQVRDAGQGRMVLTDVPLSLFGIGDMAADATKVDQIAKLDDQSIADMPPVIAIAAGVGGLEVLDGRARLAGLSQRKAETVKAYVPEAVAQAIESGEMKPLAEQRQQAQQAPETPVPAPQSVPTPAPAPEQAPTPQGQPAGQPALSREALEQQARDAGVRYEGEQVIDEDDPGAGSLHLFTDPQTGSTIAVGPGEILADKLAETRAKFAPRPEREGPAAEKRMQEALAGKRRGVGDFDPQNMPASLTPAEIDAYKTQISSKVDLTSPADVRAELETHRGNREALLKRPRGKFVLVELPVGMVSPRAGTSEAKQATAAEYAKRPAATAPPIVAGIPADPKTVRGDAKLLTTDGATRLLAAKARGDATIKAYVPAGDVGELGIGQQPAKPAEQPQTRPAPEEQPETETAGEVEGDMLTPAEVVAKLPPGVTEDRRAKPRTAASPKPPYIVQVGRDEYAKGGEQAVRDLWRVAHVGVQQQFVDWLVAVEHPLAEQGMLPDERFMRFIRQSVLGEKDAGDIIKAEQAQEEPTKPVKVGEQGQQPAPEQPAAPAEQSQAKPAEDMTFDQQSQWLAKTVAGWLGESDQPIEFASLIGAANMAFGGTRAAGTYNTADASDAMEAGVNLYIQQHPELTVADLEALTDRLPTQTIRSQAKSDFQQFSTPPAYALAVVQAANIGRGETVLEPSAGTGSLAVHARNAGGSVFANEIDAGRANLLAALDLADVTKEDAEQIGNISPDTFNVVVMNPPFSRAGHRLPGKKILETGAKHVESALNALKPGGRLVAIVGRGMSMTAPAFKRWWIERIMPRYNVRANVGVAGAIYRKYGTAFETRVIVIDKDGPTKQRPLEAEVDSLVNLVNTLQGVRNERVRTEQPVPSPAPQGQPAARPAEPAPAATGPMETGPVVTGPQPGPVPQPGQRPARPGRGPVDTGIPAGPGPSPDVAGRPGEQPGPTGVRPDTGEGQPIGSGVPTAPEPGRPARTEAGGTPVPAERRPEPAGTGRARVDPKQAQESLSTFNQATPVPMPAELLARAKPHPAPLVESTAMAAITPPAVAYMPNLPADVIDKGLLSVRQLETVAGFGQASERMLEGNRATVKFEQGVQQESDAVPHRRGFMCGDATGVGKGRTIAGIVMDNWQRGRQRAVWISAGNTTGLSQAAIRDWTALGGAKNDVFILNKEAKAGANVKRDTGIMFLTYSTLAQDFDTGKQHKAGGGLSRIEQLIQWLGPDFDGVIVFDEAHKLANSMQIAGGSRGVTTTSTAARAGLALQAALPNARIGYFSATAATEVRNLAYASRLGLWGEGTAFSDAREFINEVSTGGLAAMEQAAMDLKRQGSMLARTIAFNDGTEQGTVRYDRLDQKLSGEQVQTWDRLADAWRTVLDNWQAAQGATNQTSGMQAGRQQARIWGANLRFWNMVSMSMSAPVLIDQIEQQIAAGESAVVQIVNTGQAAQERKIANMDEDATLDSIDLSPRQEIMELVEQAFPTQQFESVIDPVTGNTVMQAVTDSQGNPVQNQDALRMKNQLLEDLGMLAVPNNPLDILIEHFGADAIAEVTGRSRRLVTKDNKKVEQRLSPTHREKEVSAFLDGKKRILVYSGAGNTGRDYHASRAVKNQEHRNHFVWQPGWRADECMQGLGRTHRTNQASAPTYWLVSLGLNAYKRFTTSISRRLAQLGALSKGQRSAAAGGLFDPMDNLESQEAIDALYNLCYDIFTGAENLPVSREEFEQQTRLRLTDNDGNFNRSTVPPMTRFLNRLLNLRVELQDALFDAFEHRWRSRIDQAIEAGTFDTGMETVRADRGIEKIEDRVIWTDPDTGATLDYVRLMAKRSAQRVTWEQSRRMGVQGGKPEYYVYSKKSERIYAVSPAANAFDTRRGTPIARVRMAGVERSHIQHREEWRLGGTNWERIDDLERARELWEANLAKLPDFTSHTLHMVSGIMLPVYRQIAGHPKMWRAVTAEGEQILGRILTKNELSETFKRLGVSSTFKMTPAQAHAALVAGTLTLELENGWTITRARVSGENRIEVKNAVMGGDVSAARQAGAFTEIVAYRTRLFIPTSEAGVATLEAILKRHPVTNSIDEGGPTPDQDVGGQPDDTDYGRLPKAATGRKSSAGGPVRPAGPEQFTFSTAAYANLPPETGRGKVASKKQQADGKRPKGKAKFGLRSIVRFAFDALNTPLFVGKVNTQKKRPAHFKKPQAIVRSRAAQWQLNFHEIGHAISYRLLDEQPNMWDALEPELVALTQMDGSMASAESAEEGAAEFVRRYVVDPLSINAGLTQRFTDAVNRVGPGIMQVLHDTHRLYAAHQARPLEDQLATQTNDTGQPAGLVAGFKAVGLNMLFNVIGPGTAIHALKVGTFKAITGLRGPDPFGLRGLLKEKTDPAYRSRLALARQFLKEIEDSPADITNAYQMMIHIPQEVDRALWGVHQGREGIRVLQTAEGFDALSEDSLLALEEAGFDVPEPGVSPGHGGYIYLSEQSIGSIRQTVGRENWETFKVYGQYRAALDRFKTKGHVYPGLTDGVNPDKLEAWIKEQDAAHPDWNDQFKAINHYMDQLVLVAVLSGELDVPAAVRIKQAWNDYWPLPRQTERVGRKSGLGVEPTAGIRRAFGSNLPFRSLEEAVETRTKMALESYYQNRMMWAVCKYGEVLDNLKGVPFDVRKDARRLMLPLHLDPKKVATLSEDEQKAVVADYLNRTKLVEFAGAELARMGLEVEDLEKLPLAELRKRLRTIMPQIAENASLADILEAIGKSMGIQFEPVKAADINLSFPGRALFRAKKPNAVNVVGAFFNGKRQYFQVPDMHLFEIFAKSQPPGPYVQTINRIAGGTIKPWKRAITQNLAFAIRNLFRDMNTAMFLGDDGLKSLIPFYYISIGLVNRLKGDPAGIRQHSAAELLSKALDATTRDSHQSVVHQFKSVLSEGIIPEGYADLPMSDKLASLPGQIQSMLLKVADVLNVVTGGRWLSQTTESLAREGAYIAKLRQGYSVEAAQTAYDRITGNFGQRGANANAASFVGMAGFLNPALQIMWGQVEKFTHPDPKVRAFHAGFKLPIIASWGAVGAALNFLLTAALHPDDDDRDEVFARMRERLDEDRLSYMAIGGKVRLPFDYGMVGSVASFGWNSVEEQLLDDPIAGQKKAGELLERARDLPGPTEWLMPHFKTLVELYVNHSFFFNEAIVPEWMSAAYPHNPELQTWNDMPAIYNQIGQGIGVSPIKVRYFVRNIWTQQMDDMVRTVEHFTGTTQFKEPADLPVIGRLIQREPRGWYSQSVKSVAELETDYAAAKAFVKHVEGQLTAGKLDPAEYQDKLAEAQARLDQLEAAHAQFRAIEDTWDQIKAERKRPGTDWERIRQLERSMTEQAQRFYEWQRAGRPVGGLSKQVETSILVAGYADAYRQAAANQRPPEGIDELNRKARQIGADAAELDTAGRRTARKQFRDRFFEAIRAENQPAASMFAQQLRYIDMPEDIERSIRDRTTLTDRQRELAKKVLAEHGLY